MDVRDLASALLALGDLFQEANRVLNDDRAKLDVKVKADFEAACFGVHLVLTQDAVDVAKASLFVAASFSVSDILTYLGFFGIDGKGVLQLLKRLRGAPPQDVKQLENNTVQINDNHGTVIVVTGETAKLADSAQIRAALAKALEPLDREGITSFEVRNAETRATIAKVERQERRYFSAEVPIVPSIPDEPDLLDDTSEAVLVLRRAAFDGNLNWEFSDGSANYSASIEDRDFLGRVDRNELEFGAHDALRVRMRRRTRRDRSGRLATYYAITQVIDVIRAPRPKQSLLFSE